MNKQLKELQSQTGTTKYNINDLKQIQENIDFIINKKGYGKKYYTRKRRQKKIKSFFNIFKKKELKHD